MTKVHVWVELTDDEYRAFEHEAEREKRTVTSLVQHTVQVLWNEMRHDEETGTDHPIIQA
ncbi:MAG: hypothetical protein FJ265_10970 [Planctomycetes bacterium]|nr:hypothetical protein [Planctomycetota bacterium]